MGGKCFGGEEKRDDPLSIPLVAQSLPQKLPSPLLSRGDLDLAETRIKCQILEKQFQDERVRCEGLQSELKAVDAGNESAREAIREINAKIQQLELKAMSLRCGTERFSVERGETERKKTGGKEKQRKQELIVAKAQLQDVEKEKTAIEAQTAAVKAEIAVGEQTIREMESSIQKPLQIPSMKRHYVRGVVLQLRKWQLRKDMDYGKAIGSSGVRCGRSRSGGRLGNRQVELHCDVALSAPTRRLASRL